MNILAMPFIDIEIPEVIYEKLPHLYMSIGVGLLIFGGRFDLMVLGAVFIALGISVFNARRIYRIKKYRKKTERGRNEPPKRSKYRF